MVLIVITIVQTVAVEFLECSLSTNKSVDASYVFLTESSQKALE